MEADVREVLRSGKWVQGPKVEMLEGCLAQEFKMPYAACVASGTAALKLALLAVGVNKGHKVLVPAYTCVALPNAVLACGAEPIAVDVSPDSWNIDAEGVARSISRCRPKAILGVHLFGLPFALNKEIGKTVSIIEDCSHGFGAAGAAHLGGKHGVAITSLYATKFIGGVEGGAVMARDKKIARYIREFRDYTDKEPGAQRMNEKMSDIEAAMVLGRLRSRDINVRNRQAKAAKYTKELGALAQAGRQFSLPKVIKNRIWYRYVVEMKTAPAQEMVDRMAAFGISVAMPVHDWLPTSAKTPVARRAYRNLLSLPLYPDLTSEEQDRVISSFKMALSQIHHD